MSEPLKIHTLAGDPGRQQKVKRVGRGRGSGHGGRSGRGNKGLKARSGGRPALRFEGGQMPLVRSVPKRGFNNPNKIYYQVVNLRQLNEFTDGSVVDAQALRGKGLIGSIKKPVKLLAKGELTRSNLTIKLDAVSGTAAKAIADRKGKVEAKHVGTTREKNAPRRRSAEASE